MFTFSVLDQKNPFWVNLVKKIKIVSLSWNLVPRLIWISEIQWWCSIVLFLTINIFRGQIWSKIFGNTLNLIQKIKRIILRRNLVPTLGCLIGVPKLIDFSTFFYQNIVFPLPSLSHHPFPPSPPLTLNPVINYWGKISTRDFKTIYLCWLFCDIAKGVPFL